MAKITVRDNGPLLVEGDDVNVCDASGAEFSPAGRPFGTAEDAYRLGNEGF